MSYIPSYIRPVGGAIPTTIVTAVTSSFASSRPVSSSVITSTVTSPSVSIVSSTRTSPTQSMKDENIGFSPEAKGYRRYERSSSSYIGYREDYIRRQNDKVSGKKSLEERLKSLEADASVTLKVRRGSRNRRKKTGDKDIISRLRSRDKGLLSPNSTMGRSGLKKGSLSDSSSSTPSSSVPSHSVTPIHTVSPNTEKSPETDFLKVTKNTQNTAQPHLSNATTTIRKDVTNHSHCESQTDRKAEKSIEGKPIVDSGSKQPRPEPRNSPSRSLEVVPLANLTPTDPIPIDPIPNAVRKLTGDEKIEAVFQEFDSELASMREGKTPYQSSREKKTHHSSKEIKSNQSSVSESFPTVVFKKENSKEASSSAKRTSLKTTNLSDVLDPTSDSRSTATHKSSGIPSQKEILKASQTPPNDKDPTPSPPIITSTISPSNVGNQTEENDVTPEIMKAIPWKDKPTVLDVASNSAVIPVELRSPRSGPLREGGSRGSSNREKRNAMVFVFPSSDDSETENVLARLRVTRRDHLEHFSLAGNNSVAPCHEATVDRLMTSSSSSSSLPNNDKKTTSEDKTLLSNPTRPQRRKSSRSPKRSTPKRANRSKSSNERSNTEKIKPSRTLSGGSQSPTTISVGSADASTNMSPDTLTSASVLERTDGKSPRLRHKPEYNELTSIPNKSESRGSKRIELANLSSPRQRAVADAVKFGFPDTDETIPFIDGATMQQEQNIAPVHESKQPPENANPSTVKRAFPLSRDGRSIRRKGEPRRTSYKEAMESTNPTESNEQDTKWARQGIIFSDSDKEEFLANLGKLVRSNSVDSVLSTSDASSSVVVRRKARSSSADRNSLKGVYRRSYQIATNQLTDQEDTGAPDEKLQANIRKFKNFFVESSPSPGTTPDSFRRPVRKRSLGSIPTLTVNHWDDSVIREGFLFFKVATIEKGKRTSAQKSWKLVWVVLKNRCLFLCKDWSRNKPDSAYGSLGNNFTPPSGYCFPPTELLMEEESPLNIQASLVSIAYNYQKRKHVFRLTTFNGSEYLFQAEDREEMLLWIHSIQVHGNHDNEDVTINEDLILRKTNEIEVGPKPDKRASRRSRSPKGTRRVNAQVKDDGSRRFKWRGSVNKIVKKFGQGQNSLQGGVFDVLLEECPPSSNNEHVPFLVDLCCRIVEQHGLSFIGIYRVPGNNGAILALQEELNLRGPEAVDLENDDRFCDLNIVSSLLKSFFRKLPDPLFTNELYEDFIAMNRKEDREERLKGLRRLIHMLPTHHYETLKFLAFHLRKVADNAAFNKMEVRNLAIVFGPTLIRNTATEDMTSMVTDMSDQCRIIESVLRHTGWFFADNENEISRVPITNVPRVGPENLTYGVDHLLANVSQTTGDISDTASESSKSKTSCASEKESFSRDVICSLFDAEKKWVANTRDGDLKRNRKAASDDEDFEFKSTQFPQFRRCPKSPLLSPPQSPLSSISSTSHGGANSKPFSGSIRSTLRGSREHLPLDYHGRLRDFFVESLEWLGKPDASRSFPHFSSSSTESSPQITPRTSIFGIPQAGVQRTFPGRVRRLSEGKLVPSINAPASFTEYTRQSSTPVSSPSVQRAQRFGRDPKSPHSMGYWYHNMRENQLRPFVVSRSRSELSSRESLMADVESDSDASVQLGNSLDDKMRSLSLPSKRQDRVPRRKTPSESHPLKPSFTYSTPLKQLNKNMGHQVEYGSSDSLVSSKRSAQELYAQRKAQRRQFRALMKASMSRKGDVDLSRCTSDENIYALVDPLRALRLDVDASTLQRRISGSKVRRRHTLGGGDFPDQSAWDRSHYASLQNIPRDVHDVALSRLRPHLRSSAPSLSPITISARFV